MFYFSCCKCYTEDDDKQKENNQMIPSTSEMEIDHHILQQIKLLN